MKNLREPRRGEPKQIVTVAKQFSNIKKEDAREQLYLEFLDSSNFERYILRDAEQSGRHAGTVLPQPERQREETRME